MKTIILAHTSISKMIRELPVASKPLSLETLGCCVLEVQTAREVEGTLWGRVAALGTVQILMGHAEV